MLQVTKQEQCWDFIYGNDSLATTWLKIEFDIGLNILLW